MKIYNVNPNKLHGELNKAEIFPLLVQNDTKDNEYIAENTWITFEDGADMELVQQIIDAHDPTPGPPPKTDIEILKEENSTLKQRLYDAEQVASDNSQSQQELLELLLEMGVI